MKSLDTIRVAGLALALATTTLIGCDSGALDGDSDGGSGGETTTSTNDTGADAQDAPAADNGGADMEAFGQRMSEALAQGDTASVLANVKGVGLPDGWQTMLTPMLASMGGQDLESEIKPVSDFSREDLQWPEGDLPEALGDVEHILEVKYSNTDENGDSESGRFTFPLTQEDGEWRLLLVGPDA